jgi:hypothetical protein
LRDEGFLKARLDGFLCTSPQQQIC